MSFYFPFSFFSLDFEMRHRSDRLLLAEEQLQKQYLILQPGGQRHPRHYEQQFADSRQRGQQQSSQRNQRATDRRVAHSS